MWGDWGGYRRLRVAGMHRVIYRLDYRDRRIEVVAVGPRGSVYD